jgi:hypothetical protein
VPHLAEAGLFIHTGSFLQLALQEVSEHLLFETHS